SCRPVVSAPKHRRRHQPKPLLTLGYHFYKLSVTTIFSCLPRLRPRNIGGGTSQNLFYLSLNPTTPLLHYSITPLLHYPLFTPPNHLLYIAFPVSWSMPSISFLKKWSSNATVASFGV